MGENLIPPFTLLQTYVKRKYFVSTMLRSSSAIEYPVAYYETIAWTWNAKTGETSEIVAVRDGGRSMLIALHQHNEVVRELIETL